MKGIRTLLLSGVLVFAITAFGQDTKSAADRGVPAKATSGGAPGTMFRDCPDCPEMVVIPAGNFIMGSSASEKSWAATHGASAESVSDESPQHPVSLRSFALGKYDVTRGEYVLSGSSGGGRVAPARVKSEMRDDLRKLRGLHAAIERAIEIEGQLDRLVTRDQRRERHDAAVARR